MSSQISAFQTTINQNWNQNPYSVTWAPHLTGAESDQFTTLLNPNYYSQTVLTQLQELQATGATAVTVHINFPILYQPFYTYQNNPTQYAQFVAFYQQLVSDVHARGMKLIVEALVSEALAGTQGAAFIPYYQSLDWNDYMNARAQNTVNVAQLIQPDYMSLICEPDSEATNGLQPTEDSPTGAMQLLETDLAALQQANVTNVTIGAGAGSWIPSFTTYIQEFAATPLDYIDMHVYPVNDNDLTNILTGASIAQQAGLSVAVSEAWPDKESDSELGTLDVNTLDSRDVFSFWAPIDQAFMQAMFACAQYEQFLFEAPSFPQYWAAYLDYNTYGTDTPEQLLPIAFSAAAAANDVGAFTSSGQAFSSLIMGLDTTVPSTPAAPTASSIGSAGATLTWTPSTDNVGVAGYNVYRDNVIIAQDAVPPYYDSGLTPGLTYTYNLSAFDVAGNVSGVSDPLSVTTIDTTPPSVPADLVVTGVTQNSVSLIWTPSVDSGGVGGYRVLKGTSPSNLQIVAPSVTTTTYLDSNAIPNSTYYYEVEAYNTIGLTSAPSSMVTAATLVLPAPTNLAASAVSNTSISLAWTPSGGTDLPVGYRILKGTTSGTLNIIVASNRGTTYTDTAVAPNTTYYYEVEMVDVLGLTSLPSNLLVVNTQGSPTPQPPTGLAATNITNTQVVLAWNASTGADPISSYRILRGTSAGSLSTIASGITVTTYTDSKVAPATTYYYEVEAVDAKGLSSPPSGVLSVTTQGNPTPQPPAGLTAATVTNTQVVLTWTASTGADPISSYRILRGTSPGSLSIIASGITMTTYTDSKVAPATTYYYEVEGVDAKGVSSLPSDVLTVTTQGNPTPQSPTSLTATTVTNTQVVLAWTASTGTDPISSYRILRGTSPGSLSTIASGITVTTYADSKVAPATTYYYEVEAVDSKGLSSPPSEMLTVTTAANPTPQPPTGLTATTVTNTQVVLAWTASTGADPISSYRILRGTSPGSLSTIASAITATTYTDSKVAPATTYYYEVESVDAKGVSSPPSNMLSVTTLANPTPQPPTDLVVTNMTNTQAVLTWDASTGADPISSYRIYRGTSPNSLTIIASGVTATTYTDSKVLPATTYYYEIEAVDAKGLASPPCPIVMNTTMPPPEPPADLSVITNSNISVTLNWAAPGGSDPAASYKLYKGTSPTALNPTATGLTATTYTDTRVGPSSTYYYQVVAVDSNGQSSIPSNQVSVLP